MSEFEDKLGAILSNPDAMSQIMSLAQSLGSSSDTPASSPPPPPDPGEVLPDASTLLGMIGDMDPQLIQSGIRLFSQLSSTDDERVALLQALKPFLKAERYTKVDRAIQIARLSRILRIAFQLFKGKGEEFV